MALDEEALLDLAELLRANRYHFTTITPASHSRVLSRGRPKQLSLADIFGWNWSFDIEHIDRTVAKHLEKSGVLQKVSTNLYKSSIRFSTRGDQLFIHSEFPTDDEESVFFGPDTYRFVRFLLANVKSKVGRAIDLGAGTGAGGLSIANFCSELVLSDVADKALSFAKFNLRLNRIHANTKVQIQKSDLLEKIEGNFDLIVANPPFMIDSKARKYRDGGSESGLEITRNMIKAVLPRLNPRGRLLLYTGVPIQSGTDPLMKFLSQLDSKYSWHYEEIDPDIFGEELSGDNYQEVDRIAATGTVLERNP